MVKKNAKINNKSLLPSAIDYLLLSENGFCDVLEQHTVQNVGLVRMRVIHDIYGICIQEEFRNG